MSLAGLANGAARAAPLARAVPLEEQEPIRADWRRILEPTRNWYYPGSKSEVNLGAAQVQMHNDALQPRHHHAMEQIRYVTAGSMSYGRNQKAQAGDLVYFPESVPYGPVQYSEGHMFVLQWPGPSVNGRFIAIHEMQLAAKEIVKGGGKFDQAKGGVFIHPDGRIQEGYEAIAEFMNGGPLTYSPPRFDNQVHVKSSVIEAMPIKGAAGVSIKHLGFFTERGPNVKLLQLQAGAELAMSTAQSQQVWDVINGSIAYDGADHGSRSLLYVSPGAVRGVVRANTDTEILVVHLSPIGADGIPFTEF
jgi:hypothetical protein